MSLSQLFFFFFWISIKVSGTPLSPHPHTFPLIMGLMIWHKTRMTHTMKAEQKAAELHGGASVSPASSSGCLPHGETDGRTRRLLHGEPPPIWPTEPARTPAGASETRVMSPRSGLRGCSFTPEERSKGSAYTYLLVRTTHRAGL